ncbi:Hypothetical predicted protein [Pelobates cultripes]|uniref:Cytoskeleton-associated protein 2 C-terminal domain-containing protein n=1 Tax=Pelobates cultripes TaxID=61616 RepID=A0AAD1R997_PELCU|nr:Hypothetical predicted protein [Pelobates cultripes]
MQRAAAMAGIMQPLAASRRQQPHYREQRRKKVEEILSRKMSIPKPSQPTEQPAIRSPLTETGNKTLLQRTEILKPAMQKMANKENVVIRNKREGISLTTAVKKTDAPKAIPASGAVLPKPNQRKEGRGMTIGQPFLKTKIFNDPQLKDEKLKMESSKDILGKPSKPALGIYRGKVVQSKINSFRNSSERANEHNLTDEVKLGATALKVAATKKSSAPVKQMAKPAPASSTEQKRPPASKVRAQMRPSAIITKSKTEPVVTHRHTTSSIHSKPKIQTLLQRPNPVAHQAKMVNKSDRTAHLKPVAVPQKNKPAQQPTTGNKYSRPIETAEQRRARLAEWRAAKGKVIKRPPTAVPKSCTTSKVPKEIEFKSESEPPRDIEEPGQLFWATMAEEDEQELFTQKVNQMFEECRKLIDEDCPKEDVLELLETQVQSLPEAKKLSKYWICLARLEQREGQLEKVIAICEEAAKAGAQHSSANQAVIAGVVEKLKAASLDSGKDLKDEVTTNEDSTKAEESEHEVKSEPVEQGGVTVRVKGKRGKKGRPVKAEDRDETPEKNQPAMLVTPEKENATVIRFNVRSTPHLEKMKNRIQGDECDSAFKDFKFITPVRRSHRIERKSHHLPDMLKDHDPCVSGIAELADLESCPSAYIFRKNQALTEITVKSVPLKRQTKRT